MLEHPTSAPLYCSVTVFCPPAYVAFAMLTNNYRLADIRFEHEGVSLPVNYSEGATSLVPSPSCPLQ